MSDSAVSNGVLLRPDSTGSLDAAWVEHLAGFAVTSPYAPASEPVAPATGERLATVPMSTSQDVDLAYSGARAVQPSWAYLPPAARGAILLGFHDLVLSHQVELLDLVQLETGKSRRAAFEEIVELCTTCRFYARRAEAVLRPRRHQGLYPLFTQALVSRRPVGVVGVIASGTAPLAAGFVDVVAALVGGNAVVLRPDPQTSLTALFAAELLQRAGLPPRLLQVVLGPGESIGNDVVDQADHVAFTGSRRVGQTVAVRAAGRLAAASIQVVGAGAAYVDASADLRAAAEGVAWALTSPGAPGSYLHRVVVQSSVYEQFTSLLADTVGQVRLGRGLTYDDTMGSLADEGQVDAALARVERIREAGGAALTGGSARPDLGRAFMEPTVMLLDSAVPRTEPGAARAANAREMAELAARDDVAHPPVPVAVAVPADGPLQAARALEAEPGVTVAYVWSGDLDAGVRFGRRLGSAAVFVNTATASMAGGAAPTGGSREGGLGSRHGIEGLVAFTEPQAVASWRGPWVRWSGGRGAQRRAGAANRTLRVMRQLGSA